ncbi:MAG: hypothetical protein ACHREM_06835, partial [Polyangiales bacterium]
ATLLITTATHRTPRAHVSGRRRAIAGVALAVIAIGTVAAIARLRAVPSGASALEKSASAPIPSIRVELQANAPAASAMLAGIVLKLPATVSVASSRAPMLITVSAPGCETRVYRVAPDHDFALVSSLPIGAGAREASRDETAIALGLAAAPIASVRAAESASASVTSASVVAQAKPRAPAPAITATPTPSASPSLQAAPLPILTDR